MFLLESLRRIHVFESRTAAFRHDNVLQENVILHAVKHAQQVGFENHLNCIHADGKGLDMSLAKGLWAFLNSSALDMYFRQFNGHTQVNATDLRNVRFPTADQLRCIGSYIGDKSLEQVDIDAIVTRELKA